QATFEATVAGNAREFYAPESIAPTDAAAAILDATIQSRVNAMSPDAAMKLLRQNPRAALAVGRGPIPGGPHSVALRRGAKPTRGAERAQAARFDDAERHAEWGHDATRAARTFLMGHLHGNGADLVAQLDAHTLGNLKAAGFDVERGTGRLVERDASHSLTG